MSQFETWVEIPVTVHTTGDGIEGVELPKNISTWILDKYKEDFLREHRDSQQFPSLYRKEEAERK